MWGCTQCLLGFFDVVSSQRWLHSSWCFFNEAEGFKPHICSERCRQPGAGTVILRCVSTFQFHWSCWAHGRMVLWGSRLSLSSGVMSDKRQKWCRTRKLNWLESLLSLSSWLSPPSSAQLPFPTRPQPSGKKEIHQLMQYYFTCPNVDFFFPY